MSATNNALTAHLVLDRHAGFATEAPTLLLALSAGFHLVREKLARRVTPSSIDSVPIVLAAENLSAHGRARSNKPAGTRADASVFSRL